MNNDLKNKILEKIHKKEISMHPKIYFAAQIVVIAFFSIITFLFLAFSLSFVFFSIKESGKQFLLGFGVNGILTFLRLFPWIIIIFTILLFFLLEWILRYFKFSYRLPVMRIFVYTFVITIFFSILLASTPIHMSLLRRAEMNELPVVGGIYESIHDSEHTAGVIRGNIISIQDKTNTFVLSHNDHDEDADDGTWNVIPSPNFNVSNLRVGEKIYAAGKTIGNNFYAYGLHEFPSLK